MLSENVPASFEIAETRWPGEQRKTSIQFGGSSVTLRGAMSALHPKAHIGAAQIDVCYGPIADILGPTEYDPHTVD
jgi:hypothetical protein